METGYFASASRTPSHSASKVHIVVGGKPICGSVLGKDMEFQFCAGGAYLPYVECVRCLKKLARDKIPVRGNVWLHYLTKDLDGNSFTHAKDWR